MADDSGVPEFVRQLKNAGQGLIDTAHAMVHVGDSGETGAQSRATLGAIGKEMLAGPWRELMREPQPGMPEESVAETFPGSVAGAADIFAGGDPARARMLWKQGKYWDAAQAAGTVPVVTLGFGKLLQEVAKVPMPPGTMRPAEALTGRAVASGVSRGLGKVLPGLEQKRLLRHAVSVVPELEYRANKLAAVIGGKEKVDIKDAIINALPEMNETIRSGASPIPADPDQVLSLAKATGERIEAVYENILRSIAGTQPDLDPVAQEILRRKKPHHWAGQGTNETVRIGNYIDKWEQWWRNHSRSINLDTLDYLRKYYYEKQKLPSPAERKSAQLAGNLVDEATEKALRQVVYDLVDAEAQRQGYGAGYIRHGKKVQSHLFDIIDTLEPRINYLKNREAMRLGTPVPQRMNVTIGLHPERASAVGSIHNVFQWFTGDPESMYSIKRQMRRAFPRYGSHRGMVAAGAGAAAFPVAVRRITAEPPEGRENEENLPQPDYGPLFMTPR